MKTKSEALFETFLETNNLSFEKIEEATSPRPDYLVTIGQLKLVFELKELTEDNNFGVITDPANPHIKGHSRVLGNHIRRRIEGAKKQIQFGADQGIPSVLLIYNGIDRVFQMFGTEEIDFITAMYGELTVRLNPDTREASGTFHGKNRLLQKGKNTSFSAIGQLSDRSGELAVTLFENVYSKSPLPFDILPPCFRAKRVIVDEPPNFS